MVELSLSPFNANSLIAKVNRADSVEVDSMIMEVFDASVEINRLSGGAFDPTLAPLINAYGFGYRNGPSGTPTQEQIDSALALVGIADCRICNGRMIKKNVATEFNFSAITKGYGVDCVANSLTRNGVSDYLVEIGGELRMAGANPDGKKWRIQIDAPLDDSSSVPVHNPFMIEELTDIAVATSGNYRNNRTTESGRKIGHTISAKTGLPVYGDCLSVTILASNCMEADGWATAIMAGASPDSLPEGVSAIIVREDADSLVVLRYSK